MHTWSTPKGQRNFCVWSLASNKFGKQWIFYFPRKSRMIFYTWNTEKLCDKEMCWTLLSRFSKCLTVRALLNFVEEKNGRNKWLAVGWSTQESQGKQRLRELQNPSPFSWLLPLGSSLRETWVTYLFGGHCATDSWTLPKAAGVLEMGTKCKSTYGQIEYLTLNTIVFNVREF